MTFGQKKQPTMDEAKIRILLLNHLRSMRDTARICESICGEVTGEPFDTWRELVATNAERVEMLHDLIAGAPL